MKHRPVLTRAFDLIDIERGGADGRTVTAYAATFGNPYEVRDQYGHYFESINRAAFNRTLGRGIGSVQVLYNHGRSIDGKPTAEFSRGIGVPLEIKADGRGLLTVTRYGRSPLADGILQDIEDGIVRAQSFRGPIFRDGPPRKHEGSGLDLVERMDLGLMEYGPTLFPVNVGAEMVSVRSMSEVLSDLTLMSPDERAELRAALDGIEDLAPPPAPGDGTAVDPADVAPPTPDPAASLTHARLAQMRRRAS